MLAAKKEIQVHDLDLQRSLCLEVCRGPLVVFLLKVALDPGNGDGSPDASPEEGQCPSDDISSITRDCEDDNGADERTHDSANSPEKRQPVEHFAESFAGLVSEVKTLAELGTAGSVDGANVFDVCINAWAQGCADREGRDAAWCGNLSDAQDVYQEQLAANSEEHGGCRHGENSDRRVVRTGAGDKLNHDEEPSHGQIPVEPV